MIESAINTRTGTVCITSDGIIRQNVIPGTDFTLQDAQETITSMRKLSEERVYPMLVDLTGLKSITYEARHYFGGEITGHEARAVALLFSSVITQVIGNFFLRFNNPKVPIKLFSSETQALTWLREFLS